MQPTVVHRSRSLRSGVFVALALWLVGCPNELELRRRAETRLRIAEDAYARKDYSTAVLEIERTLELDRKNPTAHHLMGLYYMIQRSDFANAEKHLKMAISYYDGSFSDAKNSLGSLYLNSGRAAEAIPLFEEALADIHYYKMSDKAELNLGIALFGLEDYDGALSHMTRALIVNSHLCGAYFYRAKVHEKKGDLDRAANDFADSSRGDCKAFTDGYYGLGLVEMKRGKNAQAAAAFASCAASAPSTDRATECKTKLRLLCIEEAVRAAVPACAESGK